MLNDIGWDYDFDESSAIFRFGVACEAVDLAVTVAVDRGLERIHVYAATDHNVPVAHRGSIAEFTTRANFGLQGGKFELDMRDGELRGCGMYVSSDQDSSIRLAKFLHEVLNLVERYYPGVTDVMAGRATPEEAIEAIEG